jgi:hypothetical protein
LKREKETRPGGGTPPRACCMVSELLEESGIDRAQLRRVRRQVLEGIILLCRWQLERMDEVRAAEAAREEPPRRRGQRVRVE